MCAGGGRGAPPARRTVLPPSLPVNAGRANKGGLSFTETGVFFFLINFHSALLRAPPRWFDPRIGS